MASAKVWPSARSHHKGREHYGGRFAWDGSAKYHLIWQGKSKASTRLLGGLSKGLALHTQRAQRQGVRAEEARQRPASILDRKVGAIALQVAVADPMFTPRTVS